MNNKNQHRVKVSSLDAFMMLSAVFALLVSIFVITHTINTARVVDEINLKVKRMDEAVSLLKSSNDESIQHVIDSLSHAIESIERRQRNLEMAMDEYADVVDLEIKR